MTSGSFDVAIIGAGIVGGKAGWTTHAGTNVEQPGPRLQAHLADEFPGGGDTAEQAETHGPPGLVDVHDGPFP